MLRTLTPIVIVVTLAACAAPPERATPSSLTVVYVRAEPPGAFAIEGTDVSGGGLDDLAAGLHALSQTPSDRVYEVVSEWKLTPIAEAQIRAAFRGAGATLRHLWVPVSDPGRDSSPGRHGPGLVDILEQKHRAASGT